MHTEEMGIILRGAGEGRSVGVELSAPYVRDTGPSLRGIWVRKFLEVCQYASENDREGLPEDACSADGG